ncbi:MAG: hypothetical protein ACT4NY_21070 [Pseudonocardiales bacterium]
MRVPLRTARALLIMLVALLVGELVIESAAGVVPGGAVIVGALVTVVSLTAFWWALRAWYASAPMGHDCRIR